MSTGYGPQATKLPIVFNGNPDAYELWEIKFVSHLRLRKLHNVLSDDNPDAEKNANGFAELVQCLDDRSLTLIFRDAKDDGKRSIEILRQHYLGQSKPRILSLYTELTSISKNSDESVTDYVLRAEKYAAHLNNAGEKISGVLLIAMVLKGLPKDFRTFCTIINQKEKQGTFSEFKLALRNFEETELSHLQTSSDRIFKTDNKRTTMTCFSCGLQGHRAAQCTVKEKRSPGASKRYFNNCKNYSHFTKDCKSKSQTKYFLDDNNSHEDEHTFAFKLSIDKLLGEDQMNKSYIMENS